MGIREILGLSQTLCPQEQGIQMASPDPQFPMKDLIFALYGRNHTKEFSTMAHKWREHFGEKPPCQFGCKSLVGHTDIGNKINSSI